MCGLVQQSLKNGAINSIIKIGLWYIIILNDCNVIYIITAWPRLNLLNAINLVSVSRKNLNELGNLFSEQTWQLLHILDKGVGVSNKCQECVFEWVDAYVLFSNCIGIHYTITVPSILIFWVAVFFPLRMLISGSDKSPVSFFFFRRLLLGHVWLVVLKHSSTRSVKSSVYARVSSIFLLHNCQGWTFNWSSDFPHLLDWWRLWRQDFYFI